MPYPEQKKGKRVRGASSLSAPGTDLPVASSPPCGRGGKASALAVLNVCSWRLAAVSVCVCVCRKVGE